MKEKIVSFDYGYGEKGFGGYIRDSRERILMFLLEEDHIKKLHIKRTNEKHKT